VTYAIGIDDVRRAAGTIRGQVLRTPLVPAPRLSELTGATVLVKHENMQPTGSFKERGALTKLESLEPDERRRGVIAMSAGNHAQAVAYHARRLGIPATIVMPEGTPLVKAQNTRGYGARVLLHGETLVEAAEKAQALAAGEGLAFVHPYDDAAVMAGQGTVALEMLDAIPETDVYLVAIGGGGLIAGLSTVIHARNPKARIIGIEPVGSPTLHAALKAGGPVRLERQSTRVATMSCGMTAPLIYDIVAKHVEEVVLVEDEHLIAAARWILAELAIRADLSAAAAIAALSLGKIRLKPNERISTLICGADDAALDRGMAG
jgi:threonine dehydratase